jgi:opacity protein-like surface antigen
MNVLVVMLAVAFAQIQPCKPCAGKGWYLEYAIGYEVADPHQSTCFFCDGRGWDTRKWDTRKKVRR